MPSATPALPPSSLQGPKGLAGSKPLLLLFHKLTREGLERIIYNIVHSEGVGCVA